MFKNVNYMPLEDFVKLQEAKKQIAEAKDDTDVEKLQEAIETADKIIKKYWHNLPTEVQKNLLKKEKQFEDKMDDFLVKAVLKSKNPQTN